MQKIIFERGIRFMSTVVVVQTDPINVIVQPKQSNVIRGKVNMGQSLNFMNFLKDNRKRIIIYDTDPANEVYFVYQGNILYFVFDKDQNSEGVLFTFDSLKENPVLVQTSDGQKFKGKINTFSYDRLSDCLTELEKYLILYDVMYQGKADRIMYINTAEIVWIRPMGYFSSQSYFRAHWYPSELCLDHLENILK